MPVLFKELFLKTREGRAKEMMEPYNRRAKLVFEQFKKELRYDLDEKFRHEVDSGLYNPENQP